MGKNVENLGVVTFRGLFYAKFSFRQVYRLLYGWKFSFAVMSEHCLKIGYPIIYHPNEFFLNMVSPMLLNAIDTIFIEWKWSTLHQHKNCYTLRIWLRVCNKYLFFLFLDQNICCGYSKEPSQWDCSFEHPKHMLKLMGKKIFTILRWKFLFI